MTDGEKTSRQKSSEQQLGWRLNLVESNARAIVSHFEIFGIVGDEARDLRAGIDRILETVRARYKEIVEG